MPRPPSETLPFSEHLTSSNPSVASLIDRLQTPVLDHLLLERVKRESYRYVIGVIFLNLFVAWKTETSVAIPLRSGYWSRSKDKRPNHNYKISYTIIKNVKEALQSLGYLKLATPFIYGEILSEVATYKPTPRLTRLFIEYNITLSQIETDFETLQVIRMRDIKPPRPEGSRTRPKGDLIPIGDNPPKEVWTWTKQAEDINFLYLLAFIDLYVTDKELTSIKRRLSQKHRRAKQEEQFRQILFHKKYAYRMFNNRQWNNGGRFYGVWWQSIPSAWRHRITIDNEITTEKDYTAIHFYMLYNEVNTEANRKYPEEMVDEFGIFDPYDLSTFNDWQDQDIKKFRTVTKLAMNIMLNADSEDSAIRAFRKDRKKMILPTGYDTWQDFVDHIKDKHHQISSSFCSGQGIYYQFQDSKVANRVMDIMGTEHGIAVLPVHDSFICKVKDENKLEEAMVRACQEELGILIPITIASMPKPLKEDKKRMSRKQREARLLNVFEDYHPTSQKEVTEINPEECKGYFTRLNEFSKIYPADYPIVPPTFEQPPKKMKTDFTKVSTVFLNKEQQEELK